MSRAKDPMPSAAEIDCLTRDLEALREIARRGGTRKLLEEAQSGRALAHLLARHRALRVEQEADGTVRVLYRDGGDNRHVTGEGFTLADAALDAAGGEPGKRCSGPCRSWRPLRLFARNATQADGLNRRCRFCERERVRDYKRRRRGGGAPPVS